MEWISVKDQLPEYEVQCGGNGFVNVLMADKDGGVWPGDYTNGEFMIFGLRHPHITHWMPYPEPPTRKIDLKEHCQKSAEKVKSWPEYKQECMRCIRPGKGGE